MKSEQMSVILRPMDARNLDFIGDYMLSHGMFVGGRTTSQIVRFALSLASDVLRKDNERERESESGTDPGGTGGDPGSTGGPQAAVPDAGTGERPVNVGNQYRHWHV